MKSLVLLMIATIPLAACASDSQSSRGMVGGLAGAGAGAAVGSMTGGNSRQARRNALTGAAIGGVGGVLIGRATTPHNCVYRRTDGQLIEGPCP